MREGVCRYMGDAPSDTPTAISQVFPKWPSGWPSCPLKALRERVSCGGGDKKRRDLRSAGGEEGGCEDEGEGERDGEHGGGWR